MKITTLAVAATLALALPAIAQTPTAFTLGRPLRDMTDSRFIAQDGIDKIRILNDNDLADLLKDYDVVVYGEIHSHPGVHAGEIRLLDGLYDRHPNLVVSFEQFETDTQGTVDAYLAGKAGEQALIDKGRAWPQYLTAYRPMMEFARAHALPVVAAEAPTWAISCIGQNGLGILDKFTPEDRVLVAKDIHAPDDGAYHDKYMAFAMGGAHGGGDPDKAKRSFAAQAARDDTMAEHILAALDAHPGAHVIHYTGYFHAEGFLGTVERLKLRRPELKIAVILPVEASDAIAPSADFAKLNDATVLQLVYPSPPSFVDGEDTSGFMGAMKKTPCKYDPAQP